MGLSSFKPAVPKYWLIAIAGLVWSAVGLVLARMAFAWLAPLPLARAAVLGLGGGLLALVAYHALFADLARKNIDRIGHYAERGCVFAFQAWKSYLIIIVMSAMGFSLRRSDFPSMYLAVIYTAMGGALLLASTHYYRHLWRVAWHGRPKR